MKTQTGNSPYDSIGKAPTFTSTVQSLLRGFLQDHAADRAFFLVWIPPTNGEESQQQICVVMALGRDGNPIQQSEYRLDFHYLREIGGVNGARKVDGVDDGISRPMLSCAFPLEQNARGLCVLEGTTGSRGFSDEAASAVEKTVSSGLTSLQLLYSLRAREEQVQRLTHELHLLNNRMDVDSSRPSFGGMGSSSSEFDSLAEEQDHEILRYHGILTRSPHVRKAIQDIENVKDKDLSVLLIGEDGVGKDQLAAAFHFDSNRSSRAFETVNCRSLPAERIESYLFGHKKGAFAEATEDHVGLFERASGGTIYFDEIGAMTPEMQAMVLRVLEEKVVQPLGSLEEIPVEIHVISSTSKEQELGQKKLIRDDLLYRLNVIQVVIPPIRERRGDISLLLNQFLKELCEEEEVSRKFSDSAKRELYQYSWPGNVDEMKRVVGLAFNSSERRHISRRIVMPLLKNRSGGLFFGDDLCQEGDSLRLRIPFQERFNDIIGECEKLVLLEALRRNRGNKSRVTQQLGIPRQTLYNKLERYQIDEDSYLSSE